MDWRRGRCPGRGGGRVVWGITRGREWDRRDGKREGSREDWNLRDRGSAEAEKKVSAREGERKEEIRIWRARERFSERDRANREGGSARGSAQGKRLRERGSVRGRAKNREGGIETY